MTKIERTFTIHRPVEEVFAYVCDAGHGPRHTSGQREAHQTSRGPVGIGTTFATSGKFPRRGARFEPEPKDDMTSSGLVLPDTASEKPQEGSVVSVGPGRVLDTGKRVEMEVTAGDAVLFAKYAGTEVKLEGDEYLVIRESDLLAIVTNGKK
jgi:chaperonin GroES